MVQRWSISRRRRQSEFDVVAPTDFGLRHPVEIAADAVAANPQCSLYCFDFENRRALFVETPPDIDVESAPFFYAAQYQHAVAVVTIPLATFVRMAASLRLEPERIVLIYSVGRCGSTLLSAAFRALPTVQSMSEPDVFSQLLIRRGWNHEHDDTIRTLLEASLRWLCRIYGDGSVARTFVIKHRAFGIALGDLFADVIPSAPILFIYRDARPWFQSVYRAFLRNINLDSANLQRALEGFFSHVVRLVAEYHRPGRPLRLTQIWGLQWADAMERALEIQQRNLPLLLLRYEDLLREPQSAVRAILHHCGLAANVGPVLAAMATDSQSGTSIARSAINQADATIPSQHLAEAMEMIATRPIVRMPDFVLPGTWTSAGSQT